jgi:hypothetical protein
MLNEDPADRSAWLHALLFACRQTGDADYLGTVLAQDPDLPMWCTELIGIEQLLLQHHLDRALPRLTRVQRQPAASYIPYYQVDRLLRHGQPDAANTLLRAYGSVLQPDEAAFLRLRVYQAKDWPALAGPEIEALLRYEMAPRIVAQFCANLINRPDPGLFARFFARFAAAKLPVDANTVPLFQAVYLAAILSGDAEHAQQLATEIGRFTGSDARVLRGLGELLKGPPADSRLPRILPLVPLPTEVIYAILARPAPSAK